MEHVEKQEFEANAKAEECKAIKDDAQKELDLALPMLDKALESLKELKKPNFLYTNIGINNMKINGIYCQINVRYFAMKDSKMKELFLMDLLKMK